MDFYLICVIIITIIFSAAGVYFILTLRLARVSIKQAGQAVKAAETALEQINGRLPSILEDLAVTLAYTRSLTEDPAIRAKGADAAVAGDAAPVVFSKAARFSRYVLKGYSKWRKFKRSYFSR